MRRTRYVYLISDGGSLHKIGCSRLPYRRLNQVARGGHVVHLVESADPFRVENALHRRFASARVGGEWFSLGEDDVRAICSLKVINSPSELPVSLQPPPRRERQGMCVGVRINANLSAALDAYLRDSAPRPSRTAVFETAIAQFLESRGHPPKY